MNKYICDEKSTSTYYWKHLLVIVQTGWSKTTFVQNLARNQMFGKLKKVEWVSKI